LRTKQISHSFCKRESKRHSPTPSIVGLWSFCTGSSGTITSAGKNGADVSSISQNESIENTTSLTILADETYTCYFDFDNTVSNSSREITLKVEDAITSNIIYEGDFKIENTPVFEFTIFSDSTNNFIFTVTNKDASTSKDAISMSTFKLNKNESIKPIVSSYSDYHPEWIII